MLQIKNLTIYHKKDLRALLKDFSFVLRNGEKALSDYIGRIKRQNELARSAEDLRELANRLKETKGYEG